MAKPVIHDQDGHADDLVATLLLTAHPAVDLKAAIVNSGDCLPEVSAQVLQEVLLQLGLPEVVVAYQIHSLPHPFPAAWQAESLNYRRDFAGSPVHSPTATGTQLLVETILESPEPVTLLVTGPCTNLAAALDAAPQIARKLERVVLMAGSLAAGGNVHDQPGHDGSAEWNLYCDPPAAAFCLAAGLPLELVTLDVTNHVPMTPPFLQRLAERSGACAIAARLLGGVEQQNYYFWDTLAALLTCEPDFLPRQGVQVRIRTDAPAEGRTECADDGFPVTIFAAGDEDRTLKVRVEERFIKILEGAGF